MLLKFNSLARLFLLLLLFFSAGFSHAQEVKIKAKLDSSAILIGDQIKLHLEVEQPADAKLQLPPVNEKIEGMLEVLQLIKADTLRNNNILNIKYEYIVTSFDSGGFADKSVLIPYLIGNTADTAVSDPLSLNVHTIDVDTASVVLDIKPPLKTPVNFDEIWPYTAIALALAAIIAGIWIIYNRKKKKAAVEMAKRMEPPHIVALRELDSLRSQKLWQNNKVKAYYIELTEIIRKYIEGRFEISALEMTSDEIFDEFKKVNYLDQDTKELLNKLFTLADLVKFAKAQPLPDENEISLLNGYQFINNTKIIEIAPEPNESDSSTSSNAFQNTTSVSSSTYQESNSIVKTSVLLGILLFSKRLSWKIRLGIVLLGIVILSSQTLPDMFFNIQKKQKTAFTIAELKSMSSEEIPRYISIKSAVVPEGTYIETSKESRLGVKTLDHIIYPVFSYEAGTPNEPAFIIVKDTKVSKEELASGKYFTNTSFEIEGRFEGDRVDNKYLSMFSENKINVDANAIIIVKDQVPLSLISSILLSILCFILLFIVGFSFVPERKLRPLLSSKK